MGSGLLLLALLSTYAAAPVETVIGESVDLIEINHFYDEQGRLVFDQVIFYDWSEERSCYAVRAWRLLKKREQAPTRDWRTGDYRAMWRDGETLREIRSPAMRISWTQYDPELRNREILPKEDRRDFVKVHPKPR
ncbi:hypothetical protein [Lignipirellula cremea]|uniref:hypothetical protein n=1 Tax=Lignipirellula cremea TaxID=2528010 RepID=UPI0011A7BD74|nr:hypothetical protein [Lignipirellula cremea]